MDAAHQRQTQPGAAVRRQGMIGLWVFLARCCGRGTSLVLPAINAVLAIYSLRVVPQTCHQSGFDSAS